MNRLVDLLRGGDWLTHERVRLVAIALLVASAAGFLFLVVTANGVIDAQGRPLGTDFSNVYAAGTYVNEGHADAPFDPAQQFARERAIFGQSTQFYGWHYPPYFLFVAAALALLPYGTALTLWQAVTLGLYLLAIRAILVSSLPAPRQATSESMAPDVKGAAPDSALRALWLRIAHGRGTGQWEGRFGSDRLSARGMAHDWLLLALAFPAVLINIGHGQNGFLTAALLGWALVLLDRRPLVAGMLTGLLVCKPQLALIIPIALAAGGYWRSFAAAAATVALSTLAITLAFGPQVWPAFLASTDFTRTVVLEQGNTGWYKIQSAFSWARMWGAPIPLAYVIQGIGTVGLGVAIASLWRSPTPQPLKAAALCLAAILATPYAFDYDMMVLAPAIAFFAADGFERGFGPWEKTALAALWLTPLVARSVAQLTLIPIGVPVMLVVFFLLLHRSTLRFPLSVAFSRTFLLK
jgi:alpha-1,2-mannosyltransferase